MMKPCEHEVALYHHSSEEGQVYAWKGGCDVTITNAVDAVSGGLT